MIIVCNTLNREGFARLNFCSFCNFLEERKSFSQESFATSHLLACSLCVCACMFMCVRIYTQHGTVIANSYSVSVEYKSRKWNFKCCIYFTCHYKIPFCWLPQETRSYSKELMSSCMFLAFSMDTNTRELYRTDLFVRLSTQLNHLIKLVYQNSLLNWTVYYLCLCNLLGDVIVYLCS